MLEACASPRIHRFVPASPSLHTHRSRPTTVAPRTSNVVGPTTNNRLRQANYPVAVPPLDSPMQRQLIKKVETSVVKSAIDDEAQFQKLHAAAHTELKRLLGYVAGGLALRMKFPAVFPARAKATLEHENLFRISDAFRDKTAFVPLQVENMPKYSSVDEILTCKSSGEDYRMGKIVVPKNDYAYFKELCHAWEKLDPAICHAQLTALRHAPKDIAIQIVDAAKPAFDGWTDNCGAVKMHASLNPFDTRNIERTHAVMRLKVGDGSADRAGTINGAPLLTFVHEAQHLIEMMYAHSAFKLLTDRPLTGALEALDDVEEARVILSYEQNIAKKVGIQRRLSHRALPVTLDAHDGGKAVLAYRDAQTGDVRYFRPGQKLSGHIISHDDRYIGLRTAHGDVKLSTLAVKVHIRDNDARAAFFDSLDECRSSYQPVAIDFAEQFGDKVASMAIRKTAFIDCAPKDAPSTHYYDEHYAGEGLMAF